MSSMAIALIGVGVGFLLSEFAGYGRRRVHLKPAEWDEFERLLGNALSSGRRPAAGATRAMGGQGPDTSSEGGESILSQQQALMKRLDELPERVNALPANQTIRALLALAESDHTHKEVLQRLNTLGPQGGRSDAASNGSGEL